MTSPARPDSGEEGRGGELQKTATRTWPLESALRQCAAPRACRALCPRTSRRHGPAAVQSTLRRCSPRTWREGLGDAVHEGPRVERGGVWREHGPEEDEKGDKEADHDVAGGPPAVGQSAPEASRTGAQRRATPKHVSKAAQGARRLHAFESITGVGDGASRAAQPGQVAASTCTAAANRRETARPLAGGRAPGKMRADIAEQQQEEHAGGEHDVHQEEGNLLHAAVDGRDDQSVLCEAARGAGEVRRRAAEASPCTYGERFSAGSAADAHLRAVEEGVREGHQGEEHRHWNKLAPATREDELRAYAGAHKEDVDFYEDPSSAVQANAPLGWWWPVSLCVETHQRPSKRPIFCFVLVMKRLTQPVGSAQENASRSQAPATLKFQSKNANSAHARSTRPCTLTRPLAQQGRSLVTRGTPQAADQKGHRQLQREGRPQRERGRRGMFPAHLWRLSLRTRSRQPPVSARAALWQPVIVGQPSRRAAVRRTHRGTPTAANCGRSGKYAPPWPRPWQEALLSTASQRSPEGHASAPRPRRQETKRQRTSFPTAARTDRRSSREAATNSFDPPLPSRPSKASR